MRARFVFAGAGYYDADRPHEWLGVGIADQRAIDPGHHRAGGGHHGGGRPHTGGQIP